MSTLSNEVISIILGGGAGSRLYPLTEKRSKPAVPIAGKYRLVDIPISNCLNSGLNRIFVLTQFNSASLNRHIVNTFHFESFSNGFVDILAAEQTPESEKWYQGTADAVRQSIKHLLTNDFEYVLVLSGDQLYQIDFDNMITHHLEKGADISIATIPVNSDDAVGFGILKTDANSKITDFIEKPNKDLHAAWTSDTGAEMQERGRHWYASMGIYIFNKQVLLDLLLDKYKHATDFGKEIIPDSIAEYNVVSYQYNGYWEDIGTIKSFFNANLELAEPIPAIDLYDVTHTIFTRPRILPAVKVSNTCMERTILADGSIIMAKSITKSIVGLRSRIGINTVIENAYIMGNDYYHTLEKNQQNEAKGIPSLGIGDNCVLKNVIIDKNVKIGHNVSIIGGPELPDDNNDIYTVRDGIIIVKKLAVIPHDTKIGLPE